MGNRFVLCLLSAACIFVLVGECWATYHPGTGRFLTRDTGPSIPAGAVWTDAESDGFYAAFGLHEATMQYADGGSLYGYVRSNPPGRMDPHGFDDIELERDIPKGCPKCPCVKGKKHDCTIEVEHIKKGTGVKIHYTRSNGKRSWTWRGYSWLSNTKKKRKGYIFQERFPVIVRIKSKSGKDVRNCHLRQDVTKWWRKRLSGKVVIDHPPVKTEDYSSRRSGNNLLYGGWWFHDAPYVYYENVKDEVKNVWTHWFFEMKVFIEEDPTTVIYWGGFVHADYSKKGADKDAVVDRQHYGAQAKPKDNPYVPKKPAGGGK